MIWQMLHPRMRLDMLGYIPGFLSEADPAPAAEQIDRNYRSGWFPTIGAKCRLDADGTLHYPGDPPLRPVACTQLRDEMIFVYPGAFVAIVQPDGTFEVARVD